MLLQSPLPAARVPALHRARASLLRSAAFRPMAAAGVDLFGGNVIRRLPDTSLRHALLWPSADASHRETVTRAMGKLGATLAAWNRDAAPKQPMFAEELLVALSSIYDVAYDVELVALVHHHGDPTFAVPADGDPMVRTLLEALRRPGTKVRFTSSGLTLVPPTPGTYLEYMGLLSKARGAHTEGGPLLRGNDAPAIWYDGTTPIDVAALVGDVSPARRQVVERATAMLTHRWQAGAKNMHHGLGVDGVWTDTPDDTYVRGGFSSTGGVNVGLPYFYGGFSSLAEFDRGIALGLPAGHIFETTPTFREDNQFTPFGVGVDCSGFVSRAWGLERKIGTVGIEESTEALESYAGLQPGDVVMKTLQHVMLFVGRRGDKLLFMESTPPRCIGLAYTTTELLHLQMYPRAAKWLDGPAERSGA